VTTVSGIIQAITDTPTGLVVQFIIPTDIMGKIELTKQEHSAFCTHTGRTDQECEPVSETVHLLHQIAHRVEDQARRDKL
jgi:hypothetical protein